MKTACVLALSTYPGIKTELPAANLLQERQPRGQRASLSSPLLQPQWKAFSRVHEQCRGPPLSSTSRSRQRIRVFLLSSLSSCSFSTLASFPKLLLCLSGRMCVSHTKGSHTQKFTRTPLLVFFSFGVGLLQITVRATSQDVRQDLSSAGG